MDFAYERGVGPTDLARHAPATERPENGKARRRVGTDSLVSDSQVRRQRVGGVHAAHIGCNDARRCTQGSEPHFSDALPSPHAPYQGEEYRVARDRIKAKGRRDLGSFFALPHAVLEHENYTRSSPKAVKLLIDLGAQYKGNNNGDLCAAWSLMTARGWNSPLSPS